MSARFDTVAMFVACVFLGGAGFVGTGSVFAQSDETEVSAIDREIDAEVQDARRVDLNSSDLHASSLAAIVKVARKCERHERREEAADLLHLAGKVCSKLIENGDAAPPAPQSIAIFTAAASSLNQQGRYSDAFGWLASAAKLDADSSASLRIGEALLATASGLLDDGDLESSESGYRLAVEELAKARSGEKPLATARLGLAWTMVMRANAANDEAMIQDALAATNAFIEGHPGHEDSSSALLLKLSCVTRLGDSEAATAVQDKVLLDHPQSVAACEILKSECSWQLPLASLRPAIRRHLLANSEFISDSPAVGANMSVLACGLLVAAAEGHPSAEATYSVALAVSDQAGDASTHVLEELQSVGHDAAASRIAIDWLSARDAAAVSTSLAQMQKQAGVLVTTGVREAACRWAGRNGDWSVLAMAAEDEQGLFDARDDEAAIDEAVRRGRSLHVERLFAEALLQTGKSGQSLKLWEHIVDSGGADDFPTLLRTAEAAVAAGSVTTASKRIAAAQASAGRVSTQVALTDLLAANLEIRQLRFDRGRALLEQVVRSTESGADLRGRAQWMIGETFFMQEKFSEAIAAYRQVEAIGDSDEWTAAALVQAGKSFEQLGRTREATVCYSTLVSRFGQSRHATGARRRLAAMTTSDPESNTMRR
ncbi:tetratricopeptide repeat protein [Neorhodopirellula lusitana]|uniref:tetratricopeptide repeat protein n=1 Tax=Neorhodopirellula lusitana TaxID=445327 RepID=UPI00384F7601